MFPRGAHLRPPEARQRIWDVAQESAWLTGSQVTLMLQAQGPHLENHWDRQVMPKAGELKGGDV